MLQVSAVGLSCLQGMNSPGNAAFHGTPLTLIVLRPPSVLPGNSAPVKDEMREATGHAQVVHWANSQRQKVR